MNKFTKIISVMLAVMLMITAIPFTTFAATKGDVNGDGNVTAVDARLILQIVAELKTEADLESAEGADVNGDDAITAVDARMILQMVAAEDAPEEPETPTTPSEPETPEEPPVDSEKAQMAALFNTETAKAAQGTYKWIRNCYYVKDLTAEGINVKDIQATVDKFLGIGLKNGDKSDAGKYALIPMNLNESDIEEVATGIDCITLYLKDSSNPTVGGDSSISHITNDIVTKTDAENEIKAVMPIATLKSFQANYSKISITAEYNGNQPVSLLITYELDANLSVLNVTGQGTIKTEIKYTDFNY